MLDSIYHMTLKLLKNHIFAVKTSKCCHLLQSIIMDVITSILLHDVISLADLTSCNKLK